MDTFVHPSGRTYRVLPLAPEAPIPARVPFSERGQRYLALLYANIAAERFEDEAALFRLDGEDAHLVIRIALDPTDAPRRTLLLRKVVPDLEIDCGPIFVTFPAPPTVEENFLVARENLGGTGLFGTRIIGGVSPR